MFLVLEPEFLRLNLFHLRPGCHYTPVGHHEMPKSSYGGLVVYTKLIRRNFKLITSINNMLLILHSSQSNLNFEPSLVGIHQVLRGIWHFEYEF